MDRLLLHDLRYHALQWASLVVFAAGAGAIFALGEHIIIAAQCLDVPSLRTSTRLLYQVGSGIIVASAFPVIPVMLSLAHLLVDKLTPTFALWALNGVLPRQIRRIVLTEVLIFGFFGGVVGGLIGFCFHTWAFAPLGIDTLMASPNVQITPSMIGTACILAGIYTCILCMLGSIKSAWHAAATSPVIALTSGEDARSKRPIARIILVICAILLLCSLGYQTAQRNAHSLNSAMGIPYLIIFAAAIVAPWMFPVILRVWTAVLKRFLLLDLARNNVRHTLSTSVSMELPLFIGYALITTFFSNLKILEAFYHVLGIRGNFTVPLPAIVILFVFPIALCLMGSVACIVIALEYNKRNALYLHICGLTQAQIAGVSLWEITIHTLNAAIVGIIISFFSNMVCCTLLGVYPVLSFDMHSGCIVLVCGWFVLCCLALLTVLSIHTTEIRALLRAND